VARAQVTLSCAAVPPRAPSVPTDGAAAAAAAAGTAAEAALTGEVGTNAEVDATTAEAAAWAQRGAYVPSLWEVSRECSSFFL
jgi:hypothetical protein